MEENFVVNEEYYKSLIEEIKLAVNENLYKKGFISEEIYKDAKKYILST